MSDPNKITRADAVKLAAAELQATTKAWVDAAAARTAAAAVAFQQEACRHATSTHKYTTDRMLVSAARPASALVVECAYRAEAGVACPAVVCVTFRDSPAEWDARARLVVEVPTAGLLQQLHDDWQLRMGEELAAVNRDVRVGAMTREAREGLIKGLLEATPEGLAVLAALKGLAGAAASAAKDEVAT